MQYVKIVKRQTTRGKQMDKILLSTSTSKYHEIALVQGSDKVFRVFVNGRAMSEAWEYKDALAYYVAKVRA
jgi:predicted Rdx family selenoprotein